MPRLTGLEIKDVLRVRTVRLQFGEDRSITIAGGNEAGKSSFAKAIDMLISGREAEVPSAVVRTGAKSGHVTATFDDGMVVTKKWRASGSTETKVKMGDGPPLKKPQTVLDSLLKRVSLDPYALLRLSELEQVKLASELVGVDLAPFEERRAAATEARKMANRDVKRLTGALETTPHDPSLPSEERSLSEMNADLAKRREHNSGGLELERDLESARSRGARAKLQLSDQHTEIARLMKLVETAEARAKTAELALSEADKDTALATERVAAFEPQDVDGLVAEMGNVEAHNKAVQANAAHARIAGELETAQAEVERHQEALDAVNSDEAEARAAAQSLMPIEGLDITAECLTYKGVPLKQAGQSAGLRVSSAFAMALNKDAKIKLLLVDNAESIEPKARDQLVLDAEHNGFDVLMMVVGGEGDGEVVIEDGCLVADLRGDTNGS